MSHVTIKRVRDCATRTDGARVLVDRRWPRGISKVNAKLSAWLAKLAPSVELCDWFSERPSQWTEFRERYLEELGIPDAEAQLEELHAIAEKRANVTLLTSVADPEHSAAAVLRDILNDRPKPPRSTGPSRDTAMPQRARARR